MCTIAYEVESMKNSHLIKKIPNNKLENKISNTNVDLNIYEMMDKLIEYFIYLFNQLNFNVHTTSNYL